jgi:hypothetical protein
LGALLGNRQPRERAQADDVRREAKRPVRVLGEHEARAASPQTGVELALKRGFEVRMASSAAEPIVLRIAKLRAHSEEITAGFVPIGPTVELALAEGRARDVDASVDVSFVADHFHVRAGHRLLLAVEQGGPCAPETACWQLLSADYEKGRCVARAVRGWGRRMQFGSLPVPPQN